MRKIVSLSLIIILAFSTLPLAHGMLNENDYQQGTKVEFTAQAQELYTITVPAQMQPGDTGTVTLQGQWPANRVVSVTADPTVLLTNNLNARDTKELTITFLGIEEVGNNTTSQTFTESVSVAAINDAIFGIWTGKFNYNVEINAAKAAINVSATDKDGNDLNAKSYIITGKEEEELLQQLEQSNLIEGVDSVDALIEVESDEFDDLANTTFDVSSIAQEGDKVVILHFDESQQKWEFIAEEVVDENGIVNANFSSYSPVAFVVVKPDGTIIPIDAQVMYTAWYQNTENSVAIALTEDGVCFVDTPHTLLGNPRLNIKVENNIIYLDGQPVGEIINTQTIKAYNFATNDFTTGYITYTYDALREKVTNYITVDLPGDFQTAHIVNELATWNDLINSSYNRMLTTVTDGQNTIEIKHKTFVALNGYVYYDIDGLAPIKLNGEKVKISDNIISGANYFCDGPEADATNDSFHVGVENGDMFFYMPGQTWAEWLNTTYNGHYGMVMHAENGYVIYKGSRICPQGQSDVFVTVDSVIDPLIDYYEFAPET